MFRFDGLHGDLRYSADAPVDSALRWRSGQLYGLDFGAAELPLRSARAAGCQTIGGIEMLIAQAERQFEMWTGQRPPAGLFEAAATGRDEAAALADGLTR